MYTDEALQQVASNCPEYEPITVAQNFSPSMLNNLDALSRAQCDNCTHWQNASCNIFQNHYSKYQ